MRASEAVQRQTLLGYLQTVQSAFREVDDALISVRKSHEQLAAEGRRVQALADYARLAKLRYDEGYSSYIDVLDAQRSLFDAELQYITVQADVYNSLVNIYKAMGGGWIIQAQATANETDFPPSKQNQPAGFAFPRPTPPAGDGNSNGYTSP